MPRDGTQTYILPFPDVVADTTIESPVYNGFTNDVAQDLNAPRPISSGGTSSTSAAGALAALGAETASQVITNYDSYVFKAGSFYSAAGATGAPTANAASGICYLSDANNIVIEARDSTTGVKYVRRKVAGVWGSFSIDASASFVEIAGDTMTGMLVLPATVPTLATHATNKAYVDTKAAVIKIQKFTASGTYTPSAGMLYCIVECVGGGGGGGGANSASGSICTGGGGGGGGGYSRLIASAATVGASKSVTIGAAGAAAATGNNAGGAGGDTSIGSLCIAKGGTGGNGGGGATVGQPGAGGIAGTGDFTFPGASGRAAFFSTGTNTAIVAGGDGGSSHFGAGAISNAAPSGGASNGSAGSLYGGGGSGGQLNTSGNTAGGAGAAGISIVTEYCSQ